jgi:hypothetical protein
MPFKRYLPMGGKEPLGEALSPTKRRFAGGRDTGKQLGQICGVRARGV